MTTKTSRRTMHGWIQPGKRPDKRCLIFDDRTTVEVDCANPGAPVTYQILIARMEDSLVINVAHDQLARAANALRVAADVLDHGDEVTCDCCADLAAEHHNRDCQSCMPHEAGCKCGDDSKADIIDHITRGHRFGSNHRHGEGPPMPPYHRADGLHRSARLEDRDSFSRQAHHHDATSGHWINDDDV
jgi:hypothetical protein